MQRTLIEILKERKKLGSVGITFTEGPAHRDFLSYKDLFHAAMSALSCLQARGLKASDELVFQIDDNKTFLVVFWACVLGGIIPIPLSTGQSEDRRKKVLNIWPLLNRPYLITTREKLEKLVVFSQESGNPKIGDEIRRNFIDEADALSATASGKIFDSTEDSIAFIQFSSGSTGNPKGVILTHKNLITNITAISSASRYTENDSMLSWMPLTHDMGLIGFHLNPLFCAMNHYLIPTTSFIRRPSLWLSEATALKASILCSPNFGYRYLIRHLGNTDEHNFDLSQVRILYNGAEPVSERLCDEFLTRFAGSGLKRHAMCPVYGLAEASLAVSISGLEDDVQSVRLSRNRISIGDRLEKCDGGEECVSFVNVGKPVDHCSIRIVDDGDSVVPEATIGHVQIKGANVTTGYYNNAQATNNVMTADGWLRTGDLGFTRQEALYITGRAKDILFVNGQNYYPHDIEQIAEEVEGVELNKVVVSGCFNTDTQHEEAIAFVFHRASLEQFIPVARALKKVVNGRTALELTRVIPVKDIPRTTSGKLQRFKLVEQYLRGEFKACEAALNRLMAQMSTGPAAHEPENETEQKLLHIFRSVLKNQVAGTTDRFFEIGGNSLRAAEFAMSVARTFEVELSFETIYRHQTVKELAAVVDAGTCIAYAPIQRVPADAYYPASSSQRRLYYFWTMNPGVTCYNIPVAFNITGALDAGWLEQCIRQLVLRHAVLRTSFRNENEPEFMVHENVPFSLNRSTCARAELDETLQQLVKPFDLRQAPLFRMTLLETDANAHVLFLDIHHIIADGASVHHFMQELISAYDGKELSALDVEYQDYVEWERTRSWSENMNQQREYWMRTFDGELPLLKMPCDFTRPLIFDTRGERVEHTLSKEVTDRLRGLARANACTLHTVMFALYNILLYKYCHQEDIIIGIPVAGRRHPLLQNVVGMFVNNLAICNDISADDSFEGFLTRTQERLAAALNHQDYPFAELAGLPAVRRDPGRNPVFDTMLTFHSADLLKFDDGALQLSRHFFNTGSSKFDLSMEVFEGENLMECVFEYATALFSKNTMLRFISHFDNLVSAVTKHPNIRVSEMQIISGREFEDFVVRYNERSFPYPASKTVHRLFREQSERTPEAVALEYGETRISYKQLNAMADVIACALAERKISTQDIVAVCLTRSPELIVAMLGILKAGGCYLPLDTGLPPERIRYLVSDSKSALLITQQRLIEDLGFSHTLGLEILDIDDLDLTKSAPSLPDVDDAADHLAYVIYTSGTTGNPKGVMIEHRSLVNYLSCAAEFYVRGQRTTFPFFTSVSFDLTITSIFTPLITGNTIVVYSDNDNDLLIEKVVNDDSVDIIKVTPSHLKIVAGIRRKQSSRAERRIRKMIVGGEQLESSLARQIYEAFNGDVTIYNEYGPTETTVGCMIHTFDPASGAVVVPIGIPFHNTSVYLLDQYFNPVPIGVEGELFIAGAGVARGYLFNDVLTREKFLTDPFNKERRMYKTGDIARRLPGDILEYVGRHDQQVKINGYRVELHEVENHMLAHEAVTDAVVTFRAGANAQAGLIAYYKSSGRVEAQALKDHLSRRVPHYMIPAHFIALDKIPLTKNGKTDYARLPDVSVTVSAGIRALPKNQTEEVSLEVWKEVLVANNMSVTDNFFDLRGDSIKAVQIVSRLAAKGVFITAKDILTYHTIEQVCLRARVSGRYAYEQGAVRGDKDRTPIESWFFRQNFLRPDYYHQSILLQLGNEPNVALLTLAFKGLIAHHDGLRLNYDAHRKTLFFNDTQLDRDFPLEVHQGIEDSPQTLASLCREVKSKIRITDTLLLRAAVIGLRNRTYQLLITAHHLVMDGVSWRILLEDLHTLYTALENGRPPALAPKTGSLADWSAKLKQYRQTGEYALEKKYWSAFEGQSFSIPQDLTTPDWRIKNQFFVFRTLDRERTTRLLQGARKKYRADAVVMISTAVALALQEWTGTNTFVVEMEHHGRDLDGIDVSRTIGWFTAMYPVKLVLEGESTDDRIKRIKEALAAVPNNGIGYGIERYLEEPHGQPSPDMSEIRINYLGEFGEELNNSLMSYSHTSHGNDSDDENHMTTKLELVLMIMNGALRFQVSYNRTAHREATVKWFMDTVFDRLDTILKHIEETDLQFTPSDFASADLDQQELDALFN